MQRERNRFVHRVTNPKIVLENSFPVTYMKLWFVLIYEQNPIFEAVPRLKYK